MALKKILYSLVFLLSISIYAQQIDTLSEKAIIHIFYGEIKNKNGRLTANGCHHYNALTIKGGARTINNSLKTNKNGVFKAKVEMFDANSGTWIRKISNGGYSTFFPKNWSIEKTKKEILFAYRNKILISNGGNEYKGFSTDGIEIRMYLKPNGTIISAFPADWER